MKTFIRRPGNKSKFLKDIIPLIPKFTGTYIEPFVGTGAVYLNLLPEKAILNDLNTDIINIWKLIKQDPQYIIKQINIFKKKFLPLSNKEKLAYCKNIISKMDTYVGKKRIIMYLLMIYCSFNGTIILNNKWYIGGLYVHIYKNDSLHIFTENYKKKLIKLNELLRNVYLYNKDYKSIIRKAKINDFIFIDPPYIEKKIYAFNYNKNINFDIIELKDNLDILTNKKIKWMMTQIDTKQVRELFKNYNFTEYINDSSLNSNTSGKNELIITNYKII